MEYAAQNIRVVAAAPGGTKAPSRRILRNPDGDTRDEQRWMAEAVHKSRNQPSFGGTAPSQVGPILFLASDEASHITGSVPPVAGGYLRNRAPRSALNGASSASDGYGRAASVLIQTGVHNRAWAQCAPHPSGVMRGCNNSHSVDGTTPGTMSRKTKVGPKMDKGADG